MAAAQNVTAKTWHCQNLACWKYHRVAPLEYSKNMDTSMSYQVIWKCRKWLQFKVPKNGKRQIMALVVCSLFGAAFSSAVASAAVLVMEDGPCPMDGLVTWPSSSPGHPWSSGTGWWQASWWSLPWSPGSSWWRASWSWHWFPWACLGWMSFGGHLLGWSPAMVLGSSGSMEAYTASTAKPSSGCTFGT